MTKHIFMVQIDSDSTTDVVDYEVARGLKSSFFPENIALLRVLPHLLVVDVRKLTR